jgi:hypothetical protein
MKTIWFKRWGWVYLPVHMAGFAITVLTIVLLVPVYMAIIRSGHSVGDDLYHMFVYTTCAAFWWKWVAHKTSI